MRSEAINTAGVDKALKSGDRGSGNAKTHRQNQNRFGITSELAVGEPLLLSGPVRARPPGRDGDTAGPRALCSVAESDRMRPDRLQARDTAENPRPLPTSLHLPSSALDLPSPHAPSPTVPPFASPTLAPYSSRRGRRYRSGRGGVKTKWNLPGGQEVVGMRSEKALPAGRGRAGGPGAPRERCCGPAGRWGSGSGRRGWARAGAAPTCAGRPQAQVAEVAQAAGLRLRGGFSITTSPAQERAGRGAAPGAGARGGRARAGGAPSWPARARARARAPRGGPGRGVLEGPTHATLRPR